MDKKSTDLLNSIMNSSIRFPYVNAIMEQSDNKEEKITLNDIYHLVKDKLTFQDPKTGIVWAVNNNRKIEITEKIQEDLSKGYARAVEQMSKDLLDERYDYTKVSVIAAGLYLTEAFYSSFINVSSFQKNKNNLFKIIKCVYDEADDKKKAEVENEIIAFFGSSRNNLPNISNVNEKNGHRIVNLREQKETKRAYFIGELIKNDIVNFELLRRSGEIMEFNFEQIDEAFRKQDLFSRDELMESILLQGFFSSEDQILEYYYYDDRKYFFQLANSEDLARFLVSEKFDNSSDRDKAVKKMQIREMSSFDPDLMEYLLSIENLPKNSFITRSKEGNFINRNLMLQLKRETLLRVLYSENVKYKNSLTSDDLVNLYGKLNFADLDFLNKDKFINSEDVIKIIKFYNVEENKSDFKYNLTGFYDLDKLEEMISQNRINPKFMENFNIFSNEILNEEERKEYYNRLKEDLKQKENRDELIVSLTKKGFDFGRIEGYQMSSEKVSDMYLNDEITENEMFKLYGMGVVPLQVIKEFFDNDEDIIKSYEEGNLDISALSLIENNDYFKTELEAGRLTVKDIMGLYSMDGGLEVGSLGEILDGMDLTQVGIGRYLPDTISPEKVEALFRGYYISQDELGELVGRGIITEEQADRYAKELASHEEYEKIFNSSRVVVLTKETEGEKGVYEPRSLGGDGGESRKNQVKIDPFLQEELLEKIGFDDRRLVLKGYNNSLNDYIVYPSEKLGVMVFLNPNKPSNATYIMSIQQGMYFLKRSVANNNKTSIESTATKQDLRETEHVKVKNACRGWGKNIMDTIKKLSPEMKERLKNDSNYRNKLEKIAREIGEDYDRRRD